MKPTKFITGLAAVAFTSSAYADVTVNFTGATAFRAATLTAIKAGFLAGNGEAGSPSFQYAHDKGTTGGTTFNGSTRSVWIGKFAGIPGTTTIRCCFTGSVEGIRALTPVVDPLPPTYLPTSACTVAASASGGETAYPAGYVVGATTATSHIAFSDVQKAITPYASYAMQPADATAGAIVFAMVSNAGSPITNVTAQQFKALLTKGNQPLSLFTGVATDTKKVYATGRNDGSGTRFSYLSEVGFGVANPVKQYTTLTTSGTTITGIQLVPAGGVNDSDAVTAGIQPYPGQATSNASTVWGNDIDGNGGYNSGSALAGDMGRTSASVLVYNAAHSNTPTAANINLVTWLSLNDSVTARGTTAGAGAVICGYNGVRLSDIAVPAVGNTAMSALDKAKVTEGAYTAWNWEQMYYRDGITDTDTLAIYDYVKGALNNPANLATAGIAIDDMHVGRATDGGIVAP